MLKKVVFLKRENVFKILDKFLGFILVLDLVIFLTEPRACQVITL